MKFGSSNETAYFRQNNQGAEWVIATDVRVRTSLRALIQIQKTKSGQISDRLMKLLNQTIHVNSDSIKI